jgi:hypothetical protein
MGKASSGIQCLVSNAIHAPPRTDKVLIPFPTSCSVDETFLIAMTAAGGASHDLGRLNLCSSAPRVFVSLPRLHADVVGYRLPGRVQHACDDPLVGLSSVALNSAAGVGLRFSCDGTRGGPRATR